MQDVARSRRSPSARPCSTRRGLRRGDRLAVRHVLIYLLGTSSGRRRSLVDRYAARCGTSRACSTPSSPLAWLVRDEAAQASPGWTPPRHPRDAEILVLKHAEGFTAASLTG